MISSFVGLRAVPTEQKGFAAAAQRSAAPAARSGFYVVADKKVTKRTQVVLTKEVQSLGKEGTLVAVRNGYFRNFLLPQGYAKVADEQILAAIKVKKAAEEAAARKVLEEAKALAQALQMIGKFAIKKTVGEDKRIFGSVTEAEVAEAIKKQTSQDIDKKNITLPEIKELGTFTATLKVHPEVTATFQVVVTK